LPQKIRGIGDTGGVWRSRIPIDIENRGTTELVGQPIAVELNDETVPLSDKAVALSDENKNGGDYRVVRDDGVEIIFGLDLQKKNKFFLFRQTRSIGFPVM